MGVGASCPACGTQLRVTAKFCDECGRPLARRTAAEYKQVTVLFADVVHSMDLAAAVGTERLREIMADLVDRAAVLVERYGGTIDKFTGDGIMAVFGAPAALEDHAVRACFAALAIQGIEDLPVQLRIGLNSGRVIVGDIGSGSWGYTAIGEAVGLAQRMESVAPPGGVMLSESTARLVEHTTSLAAPELVRIKGSVAPVPARKLLAMLGDQQLRGAEGSLIGRTAELAHVTEVIERAAAGDGAIIGIIGLPGLGKSRLVREAAAVARGRGTAVFGAFCESHASDIPFHLATRLLREIAGVVRVSDSVPDADPEDVALLDDLLGTRDPEVRAPKIDPDARRRRLVKLINAMSMARTAPTLYIIEDAQWIDAASESLLTELLQVIPETPSTVLLTYRPEYTGALTDAPGFQTVMLEPLSAADTATLVEELMGDDASVRPVAAAVIERAGGNPFFAAEMIRDLAERGVLEGDRGRYHCTTDSADIHVPATLQATISARIDRLGPDAKRTLNAAAVIGSRFNTDIFADLELTPVVDDLINAELIERVGLTGPAGYVFRHPLIRTVAYESQLKADRAGLHRRLAAALQRHSVGTGDENAALIAEHLEAAGDRKEAFTWHMRAGAWSNNRDISAAHRSWQRARELADALPESDPARPTMRIAPRTLLCATAFRHHGAAAGSGFDELSALCAAADDKASLAIGMTGQVATEMGRGQVREAVRLIAEQQDLVEAIGNPDLTIGLFGVSAYVLMETGNWPEALRRAQTVIDLAAGDPSRGALITGSPLAIAHALRGTARWALGNTGWRDDLDRAVTLARATDRLAHAMVVSYTTGFTVGYGVLPASDTALRDVEDAAQVVESHGDNAALGVSQYSVGVILALRDHDDRRRAAEVLARLSQMCIDGRYYRSELPVLDAWTALIRAAEGDPGGALPTYRTALDTLFREQQYGYCPSGTQRFVDALVAHGGPGDLAEAEAAVTRLEGIPVDLTAPFFDVVLLRLRAVIAGARGDDDEFRGWATRYRDQSAKFDYLGHRLMAEQMLAR